MLNWRTRGPDHSASNPLQAPCPAVDSEQGRKTHDRGIFLQAMENFLRGIHDMGNSTYVMEKVFLAACFCLSEQYYQQNPRLVLLRQPPWSSSNKGIGIQYCSHPLVTSSTITESAFSTAPTEDREQYSANNYCSVLLPPLVASSTINGISV